MRKALVDAVTDGAIVVERGEHLLHAVQHVVDAHHVQEGLLLPGEGGVRQVFSGGGGPHRETARAVGIQSRELGSNGGLQIGRKGRGTDPSADFLTCLREGAHVLGVERRQARGDAVRQPAVLQEPPEAQRRGGKAAGHTHARGRQLADHFAEGGVLAADRLDVGHPQMFKRHDQSGRQIRE